MNKLISSTFHGRPSTHRLTFSCPTGVEVGKLRGAVFISPCVLCYSKSHHNKVQACQSAPTTVCQAGGARRTCTLLLAAVRQQFKRSSRQLVGIEREQRGEAKQSSRISATVVSKQVVRHQSATRDGAVCCRILIASLPGWWSGHSALGSGPVAVHPSTGNRKKRSNQRDGRQLRGRITVINREVWQ